MLDEKSLECLFTNARTHSTWHEKSVSPEILRKIYDIAKFPPTSANASPLRVVFVTSSHEKERLKSCLLEGNIEKAMTAPVTAIFGHDHAFYEELPKLFPHADAKSWFVGNQYLIETTAFRNGTLQAAYFMLAARAYGLDCGPMSGFDNKKVDDLFFSGTTIKSNFLCNLGYGDSATLHPRNPRLDFDEVCRIV